MALKKVLYYGAIGIGILIAVSVVVSIVSTLLSLAWAVVSGAISLAILLGIVYVAYKAGSWIFGSDDSTTDTIGTGRGSYSSTSSSSSDSASRQDRLRQQYVEGQISEAEFEQRIARELEREDVDDIDRELERER